MNNELKLQGWKDTVRYISIWTNQARQFLESVPRPAAQRGEFFSHELITVGIPSRIIQIIEKRVKVINTAVDCLVERDSRSQLVSSLARFSAIQSESSPRAGLKTKVIGSQHVIPLPPFSFLQQNHRR